MPSDINSLSDRLRTLETEVSISERRRSSEAAKAVKALATIVPEDIELLKLIAPQLGQLVEFSADDFIKNEHNEVVILQDTIEKLKSYLEQRLAYYEEASG